VAELFPLANTLPIAFPDHQWQVWKFSSSSVPRHWWEVKENQELFIRGLMSDLGFHSLDDLYKLTSQIIAQAGGHRLLSLYKNSPANILAALFPDHLWDRWKFDRAPRLWWKTQTTQRQFMDQIRQKLGYSTFEDCYKLSCDEIIRYGGMVAVLPFESSLTLCGAISCFFPKAKHC